LASWLDKPRIGPGLVFAWFFDHTLLFKKLANLFNGVL
jgi:hypothetical protein